MATKRLKKENRDVLKTLGQRIQKIILKEKGYKSLDAFALEFHDTIAKPTLYQLCRGERDMKFSTLLGLCRALEINLEDLLKGL